ncbi:hypothetical protein [Actinomadura sp. 6N118]|uniref:hypothetical protein n=1 Tax=Actinomadura sp. 6N118 TaxID=3375151 RepID=UPI0037AB0E4E
MTTTLLTVIGATALLLQAALRIPAALTDLIRALLPLRQALHELRNPTDLNQTPPTHTTDDGSPRGEPRRAVSLASPARKDTW